MQAMLCCLQTCKRSKRSQSGRNMPQRKCEPDGNQPVSQPQHIGGTSDAASSSTGTSGHARTAIASDSLTASIAPSIHDVVTRDGVKVPPRKDEAAARNETQTISIAGHSASSTAVFPAMTSAAAPPAAQGAQDQVHVQPKACEVQGQHASGHRHSVAMPASATAVRRSASPRPCCIAAEQPAASRMCNAEKVFWGVASESKPLEPAFVPKQLHTEAAIERHLLTSAFVDPEHASLMRQLQAGFSAVSQGHFHEKAEPQTSEAGDAHAAPPVDALVQQDGTEPLASGRHPPQQSRTEPRRHSDEVLQVRTCNGCFMPLRECNLFGICSQSCNACDIQGVPSTRANIGDSLRRNDCASRGRGWLTAWVVCQTAQKIDA